MYYKFCIYITIRYISNDIALPKTVIGYVVFFCEFLKHFHSNKILNIDHNGIYRSEGESCTIHVWDIEREPRFEYAVEKGIEYITDKVFVHDGHVVIVPSWPLSAQAVVMTLNINDKMAEVGKFLFSEEDTKLAIDELWDHTQLRVVKEKAMVVCR